MQLKHMEVGALDPHRFEDVITPDAYSSLLALIEAAVGALHGRVIWNLNSTYKGGGVAELLPALIGYARGSGIDARWVVIRGEPDFFELTKSLHNHLHGFDGRALYEEDHSEYERTLARNAAELVPLVAPDDVVILHDPQTAGLVEAVRATGAKVIWRCHVGLDRPNPRARAAWDFLEPYLINADAFVFSRAAFAWEGLERSRISVIQPSIDAFSPKNQPQSAHKLLSILVHAGIINAAASGRATFTRSDGTAGRVDRKAEIVQDVPVAAEDRLILQVSRWDRLKDPIGVVRAFAERIAADTDAHLMLAGPEVESVADDPEGRGVFREVVAARAELPTDVRRRVHLASLPMADVEENAAIVNALQRHATVVVQKSLAEGFGLTVAEAMWKSRPVVASRIGGIQDQIVDGQSGILVGPNDLRGCAGAVLGLLHDPELAERMGAAARIRVRDHFLAPPHLRHYFELIHKLVREPERSPV